MTKKQVLDLFRKNGALLVGHFQLSSGLHSDRYLQCAKVLQYPHYAKELCDALAKRFKSLNPTVVVAPAIGGILVSYELAKILRCRSVFLEREDGKMCLRRGFEIGPEDRVLVAEDVITTGGTTKEILELVRDRGAEIVGVAAIIDRSCINLDFGVDFKYLLHIDVQVFSPDECPMCKDSIPVVKPGSRPSKNKA